MMLGYKRIFAVPGELAVDQAVINGKPLTWNPDDGRFYVHAPETVNGTNVLGTFKEFRNAVYFARRGT